MIFQLPGYRRHSTLNVQLILVNFHFVLPQFRIKRPCFFLCISNIRSILYKNCSTLFFKAFSAANFFSSPWKVLPDSQQHNFHFFPSHQQSIELNNQWKLQYLQKSLHFWIIIKVSIYRSISLCVNRKTIYPYSRYQNKSKTKCK